MDQLWIVNIEGEYEVMANSPEKAVAEAIDMAYGNQNYPVGSLHSIDGKPVDWIKARVGTPDEQAIWNFITTQAELIDIDHKMMRDNDFPMNPTSTKYLL